MDWVARYELEPWGEQRDDARQIVLMHSILAPHAQGEVEWPNVYWPYFDEEEIDLIAHARALEDYKKQYRLN